MPTAHLNRNHFQVTHFVKFVDLSNEKVTEARGNLGVSNVDHLVVDVEVDLGRGAELFSRCLIRLDVTHFMFEAQKNCFQLFWGLVDERSQLGDWQGGVQLQEASDV